MKIVCISDTHTLHAGLTLPEGDVLVHAGDLTNNGTLGELANVGSWLQEQTEKFKTVICVAGNHDFALQHFMTEGHEDILRKDFFGDVIYLRDSEVTVDGVKFYGSPWTLNGTKHPWAFQKPEADLKPIFDQIPDDTDVLITHVPPYGKLDRYWNWNLGSETLAMRVNEVRPGIHVFGHIHNQYGLRLSDGTEFVNAAVTSIEKVEGGEAYFLRHAPIEVTI